MEGLFLLLFCLSFGTRLFSCFFFFFSAAHRVFLDFFSPTHLLPRFFFLSGIIFGRRDSSFFSSDFLSIIVHGARCDSPARYPHYDSFFKPHYSSSGFRPRALNISLQIRKTQLRGWKKRTNEQTRTWVSSKCKKGDVYVTHLSFSPCICRLSWACILHKTSTKSLRMLTHLLTALFPSSHCLFLLTVSFSGQLSQADCSLLASFVN